MFQKALLTCLISLLAGYLNAQSYSGTGGIITDDGINNDYLLDINDLSPEILNAEHGLVSICLNIKHSWISDLDIRLISPSGDNILLTTAMGGDSDDYSNTCFTMSSPVHITSGMPPFNGAYRPFTSLGNANTGQVGNGLWRLRILDTYAYADGGEVISWTINFGANAPVAEPFAGTVLPLIMVTTDNSWIPNEPKIPGYIWVISNDSGNLNYPTDLPDFESHLAIETRGSSSQFFFPKKSFSFETKDEDGVDFATELLGLPKEEDWILYAPYTDKTFLRDALTYELGNDLGGYAPGTRVCEVFLNGDYQGVYWLEEKIKRDKNRVDIEKLTATDTIGDALTGGYILKIDRDDGEGSYFNATYPDHDTKVVYEYPGITDLHPKQKTYIQEFYHAFESALYGDDFTDPFVGYRRYVDVGSMIDYFIINELGNNVDAYRLSTFFYKDRNSIDSLFHFGPLWDFNLAYGNVDYCDCQQVEGWRYKDSWPRWWVKVQEDPYFRDRLKCRYDSLRQTVLSTEGILHYIDSLSSLLTVSADRNYDKWPILGTYVWPNYFIGATYQAEVNYLKQWLIGRLEWMDDNIPGECIIVSASTTIREDGLVLSPNPASGTFAIHDVNDEMYDSDIRICDTRGQACMALKSVSANQEIDISSLPSGIYFVTVTIDKGFVYQQKLVVAK